MDQFSDINNGNSEKSSLQQFIEISTNSSSNYLIPTHNQSSPDNNTIYEQKEPLNDTQISEIWSSLPYLLQKAIKKERKGELKPVTVEELVKIKEQYFNQE